MPMTAQEILELQQRLGIDQILDLAKDIKTAKEREDQEKAAKAAREAEEARIKSLVEAATGEQKQKLEDAIKLIGALTEKLNSNDVEGFAAKLKEVQDQVTAKSEEIAQILNARDGKNSIAVAVGKAFNLSKQEDFEAEAEKAVLLSFITKKGVFETTFGENLQKAVNSSSSITVSSEEYETVFSNRILRDIQKLLVVGSMFQELPMTSKKITMQIEPDAQDATWVDASTYGKPTTVGNEITVALTSITFETFKLAAKAYMTDETEEDAIMTLLPIIRRHLIEAHVQAIEKAFMGDGTVSALRTGRPTGLLDLAKIDGNNVATAAKADGTVKVSAKMIHALRRRLGLKGLRTDALGLIVSMDAYYDLMEDDEWQDVTQVTAAAAIKLQGQVGRIYGLPVVVSSYFPAKAVNVPFCAIVYRNEFVVPRQRTVTVEYERRASEQRDAYYVTQRVNLQRYFNNNVVTGTYAAA
ncbi:capsid and scaffold protein [Vibrio phage JSF12]|uniref:Capsid and scaffold protein n=2 Tax=Jesfedecavirus TaxID=2560156 RepID=A0A2D0YXK3_9CAUD|nr:capsid and scaffold protein [Vibrio phage JSF10]YP_009794790.1 capsid and scaffold protein [Vibrio phage JSF12]ASV43474.1 capsid and scaffold protein [Vibrio phage JSF10]ASV43625.1 capsid and scaffold protein [Vibrio phage JSF12]